MKPTYYFYFILLAYIFTLMWINDDDKQLESPSHVAMVHQQAKWNVDVFFSKPSFSNLDSFVCELLLKHIKTFFSLSFYFNFRIIARLHAWHKQNAVPVGTGTKSVCVSVRLNVFHWSNLGQIIIISCVNPQFTQKVQQFTLNGYTSYIFLFKK